MWFLSLSKAEERDMKDGAAGEEKKRSERRRETTGVQREGGREGEKEQECGKINASGREKKQGVEARGLKLIRA